MRPVNIALVGCGRIAYKHVEALLNNHAFAKLSAICDIIPVRMSEIEQKYHDGGQQMGLVPAEVRQYEDYRQVLQCEEIDAVVIATESGKHAQIALDCLRMGKHVLVEKPMALSTEDAELMNAIAEEKGLILCVSHQNRFNPTVRKLRMAIEQGRFGRIIAGNARILWNRNEGYYRQASWRGTYEQDGGCLMNQCIHNIDLLQWMLGGQPLAVQAMLGNYQHPYIEAEDYGAIQIRFENGAIGNVEGTVCVYPNNLEETLTILGEKGTVVIGGVALNKILVWQFADGKDTLQDVQAECNNDIDSVYGSGHTPLYSDWINSIKEGRKPLVDGRAGKVAMSIILHAYEAQLQGKQIAFGEKNLDSLCIGRNITLPKLY